MDTQAIDLSTLIVLADHTVPTELPELHRRGFVYGRTGRASWSILVREAWMASRLPPEPDVNEYLGRMLWRTFRDGNITTLRVALAYAEQELRPERVAPEMRQSLADSALLLAGLFPGRSTHRRQMLSLHHLMTLGRSLYHRAWVDDPDPVLAKLRDCFFTAVIVLRSIGPRYHLCVNAGPAATAGIAIPTQQEVGNITSCVRTFRGMYLQPAPRC